MFEDVYSSLSKRKNHLPPNFQYQYSSNSFQSNTKERESRIVQAVRKLSVPVVSGMPLLRISIHNAVKPSMFVGEHQKFEMLLQMMVLVQCKI